MWVVTFVDQKYPDDNEPFGPFNTEMQACQWALATIESINPVAFRNDDECRAIRLRHGVAGTPLSFFVYRWNAWARGDQARLLITISEVKAPEKFDYPEALED
jgi:hypothetical protein